MRLAGTLSVSFNNGPGARYVVFLQGCAHKCKGCQNPETWDFSGGYETTTKELLADILSHKYIDGITLSGGDPFYQQEACIDLIQQLPYNLTVWCYTGFLYEEIQDTKLAPLCDAIVSGPYVEELRCEGALYGSTNQKITYLSGRKHMKIVEVDKSFKTFVDENDGYCPCAVFKTPDTKCMCKDFREQPHEGLCHCGRFEKVKE